MQKAELATAVGDSFVKSPEDFNFYHETIGTRHLKLMDFYCAHNALNNVKFKEKDIYF